MDSSSESWVTDAPPDVTASRLERALSETTWSAFVDAYGRAILEWFRQTGLPTSDVHSLVRELIAQLATDFAEAVKNPEFRFRPWLQFAAHGAWCRLAEGLGSASADDSSSHVTLLLSPEAHEAFLQALDSECSHLRRREILERIPELAHPKDWEAFARTVLDGLSPDAVATAMVSDELAVRAGAFRVYWALEQEFRAVDAKY